jgi:hypothetical protein
VRSAESDDKVHDADQTGGVTTVLMPLIPAAIGVALSPTAIIELILVLLSRRARINGLVFVATLLLSFFVIPLVGAFVIDTATTDGSSQVSPAKGWVLVILGALLLLLAVRNFRNRHDTSEPKAFGAIAGMGPGAVFVLALGVGFFNPKNLAILLAAGAQAGASGQSTTQIVVALALFSVLATTPFIVAVGMRVFGGDHATERLTRLKGWLITHNRLIMAIVLAVLAAVLLAQGIPAILD